MRHPRFASRRERERGFVSVILLVPVAILFALAAGLSMMTTANLRAATRSEEAMRAYYIADSGAQIANASIRASGGNPQVTSFTEQIGGGPVSVDIVQLSGGIYEVTSVSRYGDESKTVKMQVLFRPPPYSLEAGFQIFFKGGIEIAQYNLGIPVSLNWYATVSGYDHDIYGNKLTDQTNAVYGMGLNPLPGFPTYLLNLLSYFISLEGSPSAVSNETSSNTALLEALRDHAAQNADVTLRGGRVIGNAEKGFYGTEAAPKLVYTYLDPDQTLTLGEGFTGHGTLVVETPQAQASSVLKLIDQAKWHGLIMVYTTGPAEVTGGNLVEFANDAQLIGGFAVVFNADQATYLGDGEVLRMGGKSKLLYSSALVGNAAGMTAVADQDQAVISYRLE